MSWAMSSGFCSKFHTLSSRVKLWKSVKIWQSYRQLKGWNFFETRCRWLYCVECPQYGIRLEAPGYLRAVYFLHSTRLVSRVSIVDRQWLPAIDCCQRYLPCCQPASDVAENLGGFLSCTECTGQWNDSELIPAVKWKLDIRRRSLGNEFPSIYNHCGVIAAWSHKTLEKIMFLRFFEKRSVTE